MKRLTYNGAWLRLDIMKNLIRSREYSATLKKQVSERDTHKQKVLFICTHNSARSQMAEGFLNTYFSDLYEGYSAGIDPKKINKYAIKTMREVGIDISNHKPKRIEEFRGMHFDYVITVCDHAREVCPFFPGDKILHTSFEDPSGFVGTPVEILNQTRRVRDKIRDWIRTTFGKN